MYGVEYVVRVLRDRRRGSMATTVFTMLHRGSGGQGGRVDHTQQQRNDCQMHD